MLLFKATKTYYQKLLNILLKYILNKKSVYINLPVHL